MAFRSVATVNLDAKGRLAIPAKFRKPLDACCDGRLIVTIDVLDSCLQLYPLSAWENVEKKLMAMPSLDRKVRRLKRRLLGHATDCKMDSHGRILLPAELRDFAGLIKTIFMIGQGDKIELWDNDTYKRCYTEDNDDDLPEGANGL